MIKLTQLTVLSLALALMGFSLSYQLLPNLSPFDDKRVMELLMISGALIWVLLGGLKKSIGIAALSWQLAGLGLLTLAVMSCLFAASPRHAFLETSVFTGLLFLGLLVSRSWLEYPHKWLILAVKVMLLGAAIYMVGFYAGYLASYLEAIPMVWPEPFFMFSNVRQFNQYQLWTLGLVCLPLLASGLIKPVYKPWVFGLLCAWWVLLFTSISRGVLLAWLLSMLTTWWVYRQVAWSFLRLQLKCFGLGFLAYQLLFIGLPKLNAGGGSVVVQTVLRGDTNDRIFLWTQAWKMILAHPGLGVGPMHYAWYQNSMAAHPHNSLVQLACEWGLPATAIIVFMLVYGVYRWINRFNASTLAQQSEFERNLVVVLFFTVVASAIYSLVDGVVVMPLSQVMMAGITGLMMGLYQQNLTPSKLAPLHDALYRLLAGATLVIMVWAVLPELLPRILGDFEMIPMGYQVIGPRFWQEGGIPH